MKKILSVFLLSFVVILSACGSSDEKPEAAEPEEVEKDNEMTETAAINYLKQITHRYLKASDHEEGSFEKKSELQAGIKQIDAAIEEIKEVYEEDLPIASKITNLANGIKNTPQGMLT